MVHVDGTVTTCCLDEGMVNRLGNLQQESLQQLWFGPKIEAWRLAQVEGRFDQSGPLCNRCNWQSAGAYPADKAQDWLQRTRSRTNPRSGR
jgi:Iron-sulfur cluster-binding domain